MLSDTEIHSIYQILRMLPRKLDDLEIALTRQSQFGSAYADGGKNAGEKPLYFDNGASEARMNIIEVMLQYRWLILNDWPVPYSMPEKRPYVADDSRKFLMDNIYMLRSYDDAFDEFQDADNEINRVIDIPRMRIYLGECKGCHGKLYGDPEKDEEQCTSCACPYSPRARREEHQKQGEDMVVTASDARKYVGEVLGIPLTPSRMKNWVRRGYIKPIFSSKGVDSTYRLGDVIKCARERSKESGDKSVRT